MQKVRVPINSFQYGEVSDSLLMRMDTPIYAQSAQRLENMVVMSEGSIKKRYGLKHLYDYGITYSSSNPAQSHLFRFVFDDNEEYIISIEHQKVRCFQLETSGAVTLVSTLTTDVDSNSLPFDQSYLQQYTTAQYGDVMFICHPLFAPRTLIRTSLTSFEIDTFSFDERSDNKVTYQPYTSFQASTVTLDPSGTTGSITLTTSENYWDTTGTQTGGDYLDSLHVGVTIRYGESEVDITSVQSATQATGTVVDTLRRRLSVLNPLRTTDGSAVVEVTMINHGFGGGESITIEDAASTGGINTANINGARTVLSIIDENTFTYTAGGAASSAEDGGGYVKIVSHAPTTDWDEQSWSAKRGYPAAVTFHENRLCFGGTIAEPDTIWMSQIGKYFNFDVGDAADTDSISLIAATGDVNEIRYMVSNRDLQIFTVTGELYIPTYLNQAITPTNAQIRKQTPYGTEFVQPVSIDGATIFAQKGGKIIREYIYTDSEDAYTASAISTLASHLIDDPKCMAVAHSAFGLPDSYAALTLGNGDMALFSSNRAERRASWTRVTTNGKFCSVVAVHGRLFANVWDETNKLQLCEFSTDRGLDFESSDIVGTIPITQYIIDFDSSSQIADITLVVDSHTFEVGTEATMQNFSTDWSATDLGLFTSFSEHTGINNQSFAFTAVTDTTLTFQVDLGANPLLTFTVTIDDVGSRQVAKRYAIFSDTYANRTVDIISLDTSGNYVYRGEFTLPDSANPFVSNQTVTGTDNEYTFYIGKKFTANVTSNPIDANMGNGPVTGTPRGITNIVVDVKSTESMKVNGRPAVSSNFTGKKEVKVLGYNRDPQITITQDEPLPMQVNGIVAELIV